MSPQQLLVLAEVLGHYYQPHEFMQIAALFSIEPEASWRSEGGTFWLALAQELVERRHHGNYPALLEAVLEQLDLKNTIAISSTSWDVQDTHRVLASRIAPLREALASSVAPSELAVPSASQFSAKSKMRELLGTADTEVLVVDSYVGVSTLDCLRDVRQPIRLLTGTQQHSVEAGFDRALSDFRTEGFEIEVRRHAVHDRHFAFNERCWLAGSSLKDAGKKDFVCVEILDMKTEVVKALEAKWQAAQPYP